MATAANKNKIRTFEAEIGPQNKNIEAGKKFYWFLIKKKCIYQTETLTNMLFLFTFLSSLMCHLILIF